MRPLKTFWHVRVQMHLALFQIHLFLAQNLLAELTRINNIYLKNAVFWGVAPWKPQILQHISGFLTETGPIIHMNWEHQNCLDYRVGLPSGNALELHWGEEHKSSLFSSVRPSNFGSNVSVRSRSPPSKSFAIHHSWNRSTLRCLATGCVVK
jgi:hypothetical protein